MPSGEPLRQVAADVALIGAQAVVRLADGPVRRPALGRACCPAALGLELAARPDLQGPRPVAAVVAGLVDAQRDVRAARRGVLRGGGRALELRRQPHLAELRLHRAVVVELRPLVRERLDVVAGEPGGQSATDEACRLPR